MPGLFLLHLAIWSFHPESLLPITPHPLKSGSLGCLWTLSKQVFIEHRLCTQISIACFLHQGAHFPVWEAIRYITGDVLEVAQEL